MLPLKCTKDFSVLFLNCMLIYSYLNRNLNLKKPSKLFSSCQPLFHNLMISVLDSKTTFPPLPASWNLPAQLLAHLRTVLPTWLQFQGLLAFVSFVYILFFQIISGRCLISPKCLAQGLVMMTTQESFGLVARAFRSLAEPALPAL